MKNKVKNEMYEKIITLLNDLNLSKKEQQIIFSYGYNMLRKENNKLG